MTSLLPLKAPGGVGATLGPRYEEADLVEVERSCGAAYAAGNRDIAVLHGLAASRFVLSGMNRKPVWTDRDRERALASIALIAQAAEQGDALSNFMIVAFSATPQGLGLKYSGQDRLMIAAGAMTPQYKPDQKDDWSLPGETNPEAALAYFVKDARFPHRLQLCSGNDLSVEFQLEKRNVIRMQSGASQRLRPGDLVETFFAKRA
jgi:hypothetical protein